MQHANDHELALIMQKVDGVIAGKTHAQAGRKVARGGAASGKMEQRLAILLDLVDEPRRRRLGGFDRNIEPDFGEVGFRRIGQAESERSANSFLPRSMIRAASKSFTRPAATSARPLSISAFSAANSSICKRALHFPVAQRGADDSLVNVIAVFNGALHDGGQVGGKGNGQPFDSAMESLHK